MGGLLLGCSIEGKDDFGSDYQKQASLDSLKIPPGISAKGLDNYPDIEKIGEKNGFVFYLRKAK